MSTKYTSDDIMNMYITEAQSLRAVTVEVLDGKWVVAVSENGRQTTLAFELEAHACAYADGQRMRLGLFNP